MEVKLKSRSNGTKLWHMLQMAWPSRIAYALLLFILTWYGTIVSVIAQDCTPPVVSISGGGGSLPLCGGATTLTLVYSGGPICWSFTSINWSVSGNGSKYVVLSAPSGTGPDLARIITLVQPAQDSSVTVTVNYTYTVESPDCPIGGGSCSNTITIGNGGGNGNNGVGSSNGGGGGGGGGCACSINSLPQLGQGSVANDQGPSIAFNLGGLAYSVPSGTMELNINTTTKALTNPAALTVPYQRSSASFTVDVVTNGSGVVEQVNSPQGLVNVASTSYGFLLQMFYSNNVTAKTGGLYGTNAAAFDVWSITSPGGNTNQLVVSESATGNEYTYTWTTNGGIPMWQMTDEAGLATVSSWQKSTNWTLQTGFGGVTNFVQQISSGTNIIQQTQKTYGTPSGGFQVPLQEIDGTGIVTNITTYFYNGNYVEQINYPDGNWEAYAYDNPDYPFLVTTKYSAYGNSSLPTPGSPPSTGCKITSYSYDSTGPNLFPLLPTTETVSVPDSTGTEQQVSVIYRETPANDEVDEYRYPQPDADYGDAGALMTKTVYYINPSDSNTVNQVQWQVRPDGTATIYNYQEELTGLLTNIVMQVGQPDSTSSPTVILNGMQTSTAINSLGQPTVVTTQAITNSVGALSAPLSQLTYSYSGSLQVNYDVTDLADRTTEYVYACCGLESVTDPDGVITSYSYDDLKRRVTSTVTRGSVSVTNTSTFDAAGRVIVTTRTGAGPSSTIMGQTQYDVLGRIIAQTNALNGVTTTSYGLVGNQMCVTNIYPDGGTRVATNYSDGRVQSVTGTAVMPVQYQYGAQEDSDTTLREYSLTVNLANGGGTNEWVNKYADGTGRSYKTIYPGSSGNSFAIIYYVPDSSEITNQVDPDGVSTLFQYDSQGRQDCVAIDLEGSGAVDFSGTDRITLSTNDVTVDHGTTVNRTRVFVWATNSSPSSNLVSSLETSANGLTNWRSIYPNGVTPVTTTNEISPGTSRVETTYAPDGSSTVSLYSYGQLSSVTKYAGISVILETTYGYDAQGRQNTLTDARSGTTVYSFNNADQVISVTTPNPGSIAGSPQTTTTYYDTLMRPTGVVYADGTSLTNIYYPTGQIRSTSGSRTYPVGYTYDAQNRTIAMTNWSNFTTLAGARVTTNNYDAYRGFPTSKIYADGNGPSYTYTAAGRLALRKWARGVNTTNSYNTAGDLAKVIYNDGTTPGVTNTYDRLGRISSVVCGATTTSFAYDLANDVLSESYTGTLLGGLTVTNQFDADLRRINMALLNVSTTLCRTTNTYDKASRLATVSDGTNLATYSYLANSSMVSNIVFKSNTVTRMTTIKQYDFLNRLSSISSTPSNAFTYEYNAANQRTMNQLADGSYWRYGYDALGQVIQGRRYWVDETPVAGQQFDYAFDTIGSRTQTLAGGDQNGANLRVANYTNNSLNQITSRDVPAAVDVMGVGLATNAVTVNGSTAYRKTEYFRDQLSVTNSSAAVWDSITVAATGQTSVTGHAYVAKQPETYLYDLDGNLLSDGRWTNTWDGENRLVSMTSLSGAPSGSQLQLNFAYDFMGRRIQKIVSTNSSGTNYVGEYTNKFAYDGWNCVAILNPSLGLSNSFMWGSDLSGSQQGAGGVGGLLKVAYYGGAGTTNCFVAYDGGGNVSALINAADGTTSANYEYGPFGETIRQSGPMAKLNPFRFSTKYGDDETDLLYYGYRYYNPSTGRWLSRDPLEEDGGINLYDIGRNDLANFIDALGMSCCTCNPGDLLASLASGKQTPFGGGPGHITGSIGKTQKFVKELNKLFPEDGSVKKLCKQLSNAVEQMMKAANKAEQFTVGAEQIYSSQGYVFTFDVTFYYVCCAGNKLPEPKVRQITQHISRDNGDDDFSLNAPDDPKQLGDLISKAENNLSDQAKADCSTLATPVAGNANNNPQ